MVGYIEHHFFVRYRAFDSWAHLNQLAERLIDLNVRRWNLATVIPAGSPGPGDRS